MTRTSLKKFNCSIAQTVDLIADRWTMLIIRDAFFGVRSFSKFAERLGVARNVLADRLQALVDNEILERVRIKPDVERFEYQLTERGRELLPVIVALTQWGDRWIFGSGNEPIRLLDREKRVAVRKLTVQDEDGHELGADDLRLAPGPGASADVLDLFAQFAGRAMSQ